MDPLGRCPGGRQNRRRGLFLAPAAPDRPTDPPVASPSFFVSRPEKSRAGICYVQRLLITVVSIWDRPALRLQPTQVRNISGGRLRARVSIFSLLRTISCLTAIRFRSQQFV